MNIVAMGGGERSRAFQSALEMSSNEKTNVLIVPSACSTSASYTKKVSLTEQRFESLGAQTSVLHEFGTRPTSTRLSHELGKASLIYTIGGNSPFMLQEMEAYKGFDELRNALRNGTVHAGTSAGGLLPFELGHSNVSSRPSAEEWDYAYLPMLGVIRGVCTAHANQHDPTPNGPRSDSRLEALVASFPENVAAGYGIDNGASLVVKDGIFSALEEAAGSHVHIISKQSEGALSVAHL